MCRGRWRRSEGATRNPAPDVFAGDSAAIDLRDEGVPSFGAVAGSGVFCDHIQVGFRDPALQELVDRVVAVDLPEGIRPFRTLIHVRRDPDQQHHRRLQQRRVLQDERPDDGRDLRRIPVPRDQRGEVQPRADQVAPRDRRGDVPDIPDDDDAARHPAAQVVDVVVVVGAPLPEDSAEQELPPHLQRAVALFVDERVVVGVVPLLGVGVAVGVDVGYSDWVNRYFSGPLAW